MQQDRRNEILGVVIVVALLLALVIYPRRFQVSSAAETSVPTPALSAMNNSRVQPTVVLPTPTIVPLPQSSSARTVPLPNTGSGDTLFVLSICMALGGVGLMYRRLKQSEDL
jgi:LPXTG-motif cell wall-anchored protein